MPRTRIQRILDEDGPTAFPGVYDTLSAKIAERLGFRMAFISGYSVAATAIGEPDFGLLTQTEIIARAIESLYAKLKADGTTLGEEGHLMTFAEFNELIAVEEKYERAKRFGA